MKKNKHQNTMYIKTLNYQCFKLLCRIITKMIVTEEFFFANRKGFGLHSVMDFENSKAKNEKEFAIIHYNGIHRCQIRLD